MINILVPMAGEGSRFKKAGFSKPKPFIDVMGKPMIERVMENLSTKEEFQFILIARREHVNSEAEMVQQLTKKYNVKFIFVDSLTEGTACTVLFARNLINNSTPLIIANSDQLIDFKMDDFISDAKDRKLDGSIITFIDSLRNPKWSYAKVNEQNLVVMVKEKEVISDFATVGVYYYSEGKFFVDAAIDMICRNERVNNEFYTCPTYNYMIQDKKRIGNFSVLESEMHGIGTPEDLEKYISSFS